MQSEEEEGKKGSIRRITSAGQVVLAMYLGNTRAPKSGLISSKQLDPPRMVSGSRLLLAWPGSTEEDLIKPGPIYLPDS